MARTIDQVICTRCHSTHTIRVARRNFFQREILLRLGLHPWKCVDCASRFLSTNRGPRKKDRSTITAGQIPEA
jgi:ribosomal protein L37AE/L43A